MRKLFYAIVCMSLAMTVCAFSACGGPGAASQNDTEQETRIDEDNEKTDGERIVRPIGSGGNYDAGDGYGGKGGIVVNPIGSGGNYEVGDDYGG